jgi:hypothetical protein
MDEAKKTCENLDDPWRMNTPVCPDVVPLSSIVRDARFPGAIASLLCEPGYIPIAATKILCTDMGWEKTCSGCPPLVVVNGNVVLTNEVKLGSEATVTCTEGYGRKGPQVVTCGDNDGVAKWSKTPSCEGCLTYAQLNYGSVIKKSNGDLIGSSLEWKCNDNSEMLAASPSVCTAGAEGKAPAWDPEPECKKPKATNFGLPKLGGFPIRT